MWSKSTRYVRLFEREHNIIIFVCQDLFARSLGARRASKKGASDQATPLCFCANLGVQACLIYLWSEVMIPKFACTTASSEDLVFFPCPLTHSEKFSTLLKVIQCSLYFLHPNLVVLFHIHHIFFSSSFFYDFTFSLML